MVAKRCRSGQHFWNHDQTEELRKCCNGYVLLFEGYPENGGYDPWGGWCGRGVLVPEEDQDEIARIRATGPMEARANSKGPGLIM